MRLSVLYAWMIKVEDAISADVFVALDSNPDRAKRCDVDVGKKRRDGNNLYFRGPYGMAV
jgi:hypothetical protein